MGITEWLRAIWSGRADDERAAEIKAALLARVTARPRDVLSVQNLYDRYGRRIYSRAAVDPGFSAQIAAEAAYLRTALHEEPALRPDREAMESYLYGMAHGTLTGLLDVALAEDGDLETAREAVAVRLGAMFHLAFDEGLLRLAPDDRPE